MKLIAILSALALACTSIKWDQISVGPNVRGKLNEK